MMFFDLLRILDNLLLIQLNLWLTYFIINCIFYFFWLIISPKQIFPSFVNFWIYIATLCTRSEPIFNKLFIFLNFNNILFIIRIKNLNYCLFWKKISHSQVTVSKLSSFSFHKKIKRLMQLMSKSFRSTFTIICCLFFRQKTNPIPKHFVSYIFIKIKINFSDWSGWIKFLSLLILIIWSIYFINNWVCFENIFSLAARNYLKSYSLTPILIIISWANNLIRQKRVHYTIFLITWQI